MDLREALRSTREQERRRRLDVMDEELKHRSPGEISAGMGGTWKLCWMEWWQSRGPRDGRPRTKVEYEIFGFLFGDEKPNMPAPPPAPAIVAEKGKSKSKPTQLRLF